MTTEIQLPCCFFGGGVRVSPRSGWYFINVQYLTLSPLTVTEGLPLPDVSSGQTVIFLEKGTRHARLFSLCPISTLSFLFFFWQNTCWAFSFKIYLRAVRSLRIFYFWVHSRLCFWLGRVLTTLADTRRQHKRVLFHTWDEPKTWEAFCGPLPASWIPILPLIRELTPRRSLCSLGENTDDQRCEWSH